MGKKARTRELPDNAAIATGNRIRTGAQRLNLVAMSIRGKGVEAALAELTFSKRRIAGAVKKVLQSAIANAENNHQLDVDDLYVAEATVSKGLVMKRWRPRARGRVNRIEKPFSNIRIIVKEREQSAEDAA